MPKVSSTFRDDPAPYRIVTARGSMYKVRNDENLVGAEKLLREQGVEYAVYELRKVVRG